MLDRHDGEEPVPLSEAAPPSKMESIDDDDGGVNGVGGADAGVAEGGAGQQQTAEPVVKTEAMDEDELALFGDDSAAQPTVAVKKEDDAIQTKKQDVADIFDDPDALALYG